MSNITIQQLIDNYNTGGHIIPNPTIQQLIEDNYEIEISKDSKYTAVRAGDGLDFSLYVFNPDNEIVERDECGVTSHVSCVSAEEYLEGFNKGYALEDILKREAGVL